MKKILFIASMMIATVSAQAQLRVNATGNTFARNLTLAGETGIDSTGVLTITSASSYEYGSLPPTFIVTKTNEDIYPFVHYKYNNPIFFVNADGQVYSSMYISISDSTSKTNITPLESSLEKLKQLHGVSFNFKTDLNASETSAMGATQEIREQITKERARKRVGLLAQDVEKVFPEAVRTQFDGKKGVMYSDLVGVLIDAINEMETKYTAQITALQQQVNALQAVNFANTPQPQTRTSHNTKFNEAVLCQNTPNPFKHETTIAYRLPTDIQSAAICIYNLNGQQLKKYDLDASIISNSITIDGSTFDAGIYIYALIVDGQMATSKRMVLTD